MFDSELVSALEKARSTKSVDTADDDTYDEMYEQARELVIESRQASISWVQRRLRVGYNRAARMIERMEREGLIAPAAEAGKPRECWSRRRRSKSEDRRAERTPMKRHWLLLSLTLVLCPPLLAGEPAPTALTLTEIVARLQARYQDTQGFQADFVQEVESATLGYTLTSEGQVFFKKPGKMRWDFRQPELLLVSDGTFLWLYQTAEKQVVKTPFDQAFRSHTRSLF